MDEAHFTPPEIASLKQWFGARPISKIWATMEGPGVRLTGYVLNTAARIGELAWQAQGIALPEASWKTSTGYAPEHFNVFGWWPDIEGQNFNLYLPFAMFEGMAESAAIRLQIVERTGAAISDDACAVYLLPSDLQDGFSGRHPPLSLMQRVIGRDDPMAEWYITGLANLRFFEAVARKATGQPLLSCGPILEWGCGCGRLTRHLISGSREIIVGIDIDREAMDWCARNLTPESDGRATFAPCGLLPPTPFEDASFAVVIGVSVITHLNEPVGKAWLQELARVLQPGGLAILTTLGLHSFSSVCNPHVYRALAGGGMLSIRSGHLDALFGANHEYYRDTWHSWHYIQRSWSRWFSVVGLHAGGHMGYQDVILLQKT